MNLALQLDCYGSETTWEIKDATNTVLYSGGPYTDEGSSPSLITESFCLDASKCYDFVIEDSYGDGMAGGGFGCSVTGTYEITDASGTQLASMLANDADFGSEEINNFCFTNSIGENELNNALFVYPNPASEFIIIKNLEDKEALYQIYSLNGSLMLSGSLRTSENTIDITTLSEGCYYLKIFGATIIQFKKIIVK